MNTQKLNELAASAMGWHEDCGRWVDSQQNLAGWVIEWNPCEDLNDASELLEKAINGNLWSVVFNPSRSPKPYNCIFMFAVQNWAETECLAKTICALRASGIPESSITEATNE